MLSRMWKYHKSRDIRAGMKIRFRDSSDKFARRISACCKRESSRGLTATFVVVGDSARRKIPASFPIFAQVGRQVATAGHRRYRRCRRSRRRG